MLYFVPPSLESRLGYAGKVRRLPKRQLALGIRLIGGADEIDNGLLFSPLKLCRESVHPVSQPDDLLARCLLRHGGDCRLSPVDEQQRTGEELDALAERAKARGEELVFREEAEGDISACFGRIRHSTKMPGCLELSIADPDDPGQRTAVHVGELAFYKAIMGLSQAKLDVLEKPPPSEQPDN